MEYAAVIRHTNAVVLQPSTKMSRRCAQGRGERRQGCYMLRLICVSCILCVYGGGGCSISSGVCWQLFGTGHRRAEASCLFVLDAVGVGIEVGLHKHAHARITMPALRERSLPPQHCRACARLAFRRVRRAAQSTKYAAVSSRCLQAHRIVRDAN